MQCCFVLCCSSGCKAQPQCHEKNPGCLWVDLFLKEIFRLNKQKLVGLRSTVGGNVARIILYCYSLSIQNEHHLTAYLPCTANCLPHHTVLIHLACTLGTFNTNWVTKQHQFLDSLNATQLIQLNQVVNVALFLYFSALSKSTLRSTKAGYVSSEKYRSSFYHHWARNMQYFTTSLHHLTTKG